jgi:hypothetical protein
MVERIISGGQTGADRGGLDAAMALGIPHGGSCPKGRRAEDGEIPGRYRLREMASRDYRARTKQNVLDADGTVIFTPGQPSGGSALTASVAQASRKPFLHVDLDTLSTNPVEVAQRFRAWLAEHTVRILNVAGARESKAPGIQGVVAQFLQAALPHAGRAYALEEENLDAPALLAAEEPQNYVGARRRKDKTP